MLTSLLFIFSAAAIRAPSPLDVRDVPPTIRTLPTLDYPYEALARSQEGTTEFILTVGKNGKAKDCQVAKSSGYPVLDEATCKAMLKDARFNPAYGPDGKPKVGMYRGRMRWKTPWPVPAIPQEKR